MKQLQKFSNGCVFFMLALILFSLPLFAQETKRIMPMGNSITWGVRDRNPPPAGTHGYRMDLLDAISGYGAVFTGPKVATGNTYAQYVGDGIAPGNEDSPYYGYYVNGASLTEFLATGTYDVISMLNEMGSLAPDDLPHHIIMHLGTNDMVRVDGDGNLIPVGDIMTEGSIIYDYNTLITNLLTFEFGGHAIEKIFLCKIIPKAPVNDYPVENARISEFNNELEQLVASLSAINQTKIQFVNMNAPFFANQSAYYSTLDPTHPNEDGYAAMAEILASYLKKELRPSDPDDFERANFADGDGWHVSEQGDANFIIRDGALSLSNLVAGQNDWRTSALWETTEGKNTVSITFGDDTDEDYIGNVAILVGMKISDFSDISDADGYMIWINGGTTRVYEVVDGQNVSGQALTSTTIIPQYGPGDEFKVRYVDGESQNEFHISINGVEYSKLRDVNTLRGNGGTLYSGIIFRDNAWNNSAGEGVLIDEFVAETALQDETPPAQIDDFQVFAVTSSTITLAWTAPGNDGNDGTAASYEMRYSTSPISDDDFTDAPLVANLPAPNPSGTPESFTVTGLPSGVRFYYRIRAIDNWGNAGTLSNQADGKTEPEGEIVETFETTSTLEHAPLGDDWVYDEDHSGYAIYTGNAGSDEYELRNTYGGGDWDLPAIYTGRTNPNTVKIVWGDQVSNPSSGKDNGGIVVMANEDDPTADGYLVFIRTTGSEAGLVKLFYMENGGDGNPETGVGDFVPIDDAPYSLPAYPSANDTLAVVFDWSNTDAFNKFDVYVNGLPATNRPLYDDFDRDDDDSKDFIYQPKTHYAGIIQIQRDIDSQNAIDAFITSGQFTGSGDISIVGESVFADTAGTVIRTQSGDVDSLRIQVKDANGAPASKVPVFFNVISGDGSVSAPTSEDNIIRLETEWGILSGTMQKITDASASGGKYVVSPSRGDRLGSVAVTFSPSESSEYYFWVRTKATYWSNYVARFELDAKTASGGFQWNVLKQQSGSDNWAWSRVYENDDYQNPWSAALIKDQPYTVRLHSVHDDVPFDKILITNDPSYMPSGKDEVETLLTDAEGMAATAWTLGDVADDPTTSNINEGLNRVTARTLGSGSVVSFEADALPDVPVRMTRTNNEQSGYARDTLDVPLMITLFDQYDNRADNAIADKDLNVRFRLVRGAGDAMLTTGGGTAEATKDTITNDLGEAHITLILGIQDSVYTVEASLPDHPEVTPVVFMAYVTGGLVDSYVNKCTNEELLVSKDPDNPDEYDVLAVKVKAEDGSNVVGAGITFEIADGPDGTVLDAVNNRNWIVSPTDKNGIARASIFPGLEAGKIHVTVNIVGQVDTVLSDSIYYRAARIEYYANNNQKGAINGTLPHALKAIVYDHSETGHGRVVPNHPVLFKLDTEVADDFRLLLDDKEYLELTDTTDVNGVAEVRVQLGATHGYYEDIVQAASTNGFESIPAFVQGNAVDTLAFSMYATSTASLLKRVQGDSSGITTERIDTSLVVQMLDREGDPVPTQPVVFTILDGGGHFEGHSTEVTSITVMTTGDGYATANYFLGPSPGEKNNVIQASATNGYTPLWYEYAEGSQGRQPIRFEITARSTNAETIGVYVASDPTEVRQNQEVVGIAGKALSEPIRIKAFDTNHYGVAGEELEFKVANENGGFVRTADGDWVNSLTAPTETAEGIATVYWKLGTTAGVHNNILEVTPVSVMPPLAGNVVRYQAITVADSVNAVTSTIEADSTTVASEEDSCVITVTLRDKHNNPVSGRRVQLAVKNGSNNFLFQPMDTTDTNGQTSGKLKSLSSGPKIITAKDVTENPHIALVQEKAVMFTSNAAQKMAVHTSNTLTGNINSVLPDSVAVIITDKYGNPVGYGPVKFEVSAGNGKIWDANSNIFRNELDVYSNSDGIASVFWALGPETGQNTLKASSSTALEGSPLYFTATGQVGQAQRMYTISDNNATGDAGELLPDPFVVGVLDNYGHAIAGIPIQFAIVDGSGSLTATQATSDAFGYASTYLRLPGQAGLTTRVEATGNNLAGSPQRFTATSEAGDARKMDYAANSGNGQSGYVNETGVPLRVLITDAHDNPVRNVEVTFKTVTQSGGGELTLNGGQETTDETDASGVAMVTPVFGNKTGLVSVEATSPYLEGSPVNFNLTVLPNQADDIILFPEEQDYQKVTVGQYLVDPLMVRVIDEHGNPVPGAGVFFEKHSDTGGGTVLWNKRDGNIQGNQAVQSDADGIAAIQLKAGPSPSTIKVHALWGQDKVIEFTVESVINPNSPTLNRSILQTVYDVHEQTELLIPLSATADGDGDPITFQIANRFPPAGASIPNPNDNPAVLRWTPSPDQAGQYKLALRVIDGQGGFDQDTVTVNVVNVNRQPVIEGWEPDGDLTVGPGEEIRYWVDARDPDNDPLTYSWEIEGVSVGSNSQVLNTYAPERNGRYTLDVFVSDGVVHVSHRWILEVVGSSVEMTDFFAAFDLENPGIELTWETASEKNNLGFDVFRSYSETEHFEKISEEMLPSQSGGTYLYKDKGVIAGKTYYYMLKDQDQWGNRVEYGPVAVDIPVPKELSLAQNYPNPFNPKTRIRYQVPKHDHIRLTIYNMMGQQVVSIVDEKQAPGYYTAEWDGRNARGQAVATGLYIYRIQSSNKVYTKRMIKLK